MPGGWVWASVWRSWPQSLKAGFLSTRGGQEILFAKVLRTVSRVLPQLLYDAFFILKVLFGGMLNLFRRSLERYALVNILLGFLIGGLVLCNVGVNGYTLSLTLRVWVSQRTLLGRVSHLHILPDDAVH